MAKAFIFTAEKKRKAVYAASPGKRGSATQLKKKQMIKTLIPFILSLFSVAILKTEIQILLK